MERKDNDTMAGHLFADKVFVGILLINSLDLYVSMTYPMLVTLTGPGNTNETKEDIQCLIGFTLNQLKYV